MALVASVVAWTVTLGIINRILATTAGEEEKRTAAAIARAEAPKALLPVRGAVQAAQATAMEDYYGVSPQRLATGVSRVRAGEYDEAIPGVGDRRLVEEISSRIGMHPRDLAARLNPGQAGASSTLSKAVFGKVPLGK
jgi:hypothetical protein